MKWSCQTSKEEIIYLIKVFFPLSPSANQNPSARERLSRSKEHSRILPDKCRRGRGERGQRSGGWGGKRHSKSLHIITTWSLSFLPLAFLRPPYNCPPAHAHRHTSTSTKREPGPQRDLEGTVLSWLFFLTLRD